MLSMTGYASLTRECDAFSVQIDIKSVNGKYSDLRLNASAFDNNFLETLGASAPAARTCAGQVTGGCRLKRGARVGDLYRLDISQLEQYQKDYEEAFGKIKGDWKHMKHFLKLDRVTKKDEFTFDAEKDGEFVLAALNDAFDAFFASRAEEGARLQKDLLAKIAQLEETRAAIARRVPELEQAYRARLEMRMQRVHRKPRRGRRSAHPF